MNKSLERLLFALAFSGLSEREIRNSIRLIEIQGSDAIVRMVLDIRRAAKSKFYEHALPEMANPNQDRYLRGRLGAHGDDVGIRIEHLLRKEAGLGAGRAAEALLKSLQSERPVPKNLPRFRSKDGFTSWIRRLSQSVPASRLLHHATKIRNRTVHSDHGDWPLRSRD